MKQEIRFEIENYDATKAQVLANDWVIEIDNVTDLVNGRSTNCYFVVETEPAVPIETDPRIAELEAMIAERDAALAVFGIPETEEEVAP